MANDDLPLKLILTRWYNSIREWILDDINQMLANTIVGGKLVGSKISGTIPSTSVPYSGATPAAVGSTAVVGTATSGANHADHVHPMGILTTKGDLLSFSTTAQRRAVGTDTYVLTADSSQADGVNWKPVSSTGSSTLAGDTDVSISSAANSDHLLYGNDGKWHNRAEVFNVLSFGTVDLTGATDSHAACQACLNAVAAAGGIAVFPPGFYKLSTGLTYTVNEPFKIVAYGAIFRPDTGITALKISNASTNGAFCFGGTVYGLGVDGRNQNGTNGIQVQDCCFVYLKDCRIVQCLGKAFWLDINTTFTEQCALIDCYAYSCGIGLDFTNTGGVAFASFGETSLRNCGFSACTTGINVASTTVLYRNSWKGVTTWTTATGQTCFSYNGDLHDSVIELFFEAQGTAGTAINIGSSAINTDGFQWYTSFTNTASFSTILSNGSSKPVRWQIGDVIYTASGANIFQGGAATGSADVNLYRHAGPALITDQPFIVGRYATSSLPNPATIGAGGIVQASDAGAGLGTQASDGTNWVALRSSSGSILFDATGVPLTDDNNVLLTTN